MRRTFRPSVLETSDKKAPEYTKKNTLIRLNIAACIVHSLSFIAALAMSIVYAPQSYQAQLTTDFRRYDTGNFSTTLESHGYYQLLWVDLPFPLITAIFHGLIAFMPFVRDDYLKRIFAEKGNPLRWIEYSITASLMTWVILQLSGVTNIFLLVICGVVANVALQWQGHLQEILKQRSYVPTLIGWLIFMGQWSVILSYFFTAVTSNNATPWFVYSIIIGLFFFFCAFGLVQLAHTTGIPSFMKTAYAQDVAYLILSLTSKLFLTWNLLIGIATNGPASA